LAAAIEAEGVEVLGVTSYGDLSSFAQQQSRASAFILSIDDEEFDVDSPEDVANAIKNLRSFIGELRFRNEEIPIYLYGETRTSQHIPNDILRELDRKSTRLNSSHVKISYAVFCLKKKQEAIYDVDT